MKSCGHMTATVVPETPERLVRRPRRSGRPSRNSAGEVLQVTETPDGRNTRLRSLIEESPGAGPSQEGLQERAEGILHKARSKRRTTLAPFRIRGLVSPTSEKTFLEYVGGTQECASTRLESPLTPKVQDWLLQGNQLPSPTSILSPRKSVTKRKTHKEPPQNQLILHPKKENLLPSPVGLKPSSLKVESNAKDQTPLTEGMILAGVLAHVDVPDLIQCVEEQLQSLGASVSSAMTEQVTHLIFKDGSLAVYNKAKSLGIHIVSVGWIEACRKKGVRLDEGGFPSSSKEKYDSPDMAMVLKRTKTRRRLMSLSTEEKYQRFVTRLRRKKEKEEMKKRRTLSPVKLIPLDFYNSPKYNAPRSTKSPKQKSVLDQIIEADDVGELQFLKTPPRSSSRRESQESPTATSILGEDFDTPLSLRVARQFYAKKRRSTLNSESGASPLLKAMNDSKDVPTEPLPETDPGSKRKTIEAKKEDVLLVKKKPQKKRYVLYSEEPLVLSESSSSEPTADISIRPPSSVCKQIPKSPRMTSSSPTDSLSLSSMTINENSARYKNSARNRPSRRSSIDFVRHITAATRREEISTRGKREIVCSSATADDILILKQIIPQFGFYMSKSVSSRTTHVICCSPGSTRRTLNVLRGLLRGCWIVSKDWMLSSLEEGYLLDEEPYERVDFSPAVQACRMERIAFGSYHSKLLSEMGLIYVSRKSSFSTKDIGDLIRLGGGHSTPKAENADIVIGDVAPSGVGVKEGWLMDSVQHNVILPLDDYRIDS